MTGPLEGIRVVELAGYLSGPYAAMLLGDLGADVVKVEEPERGDPFRGWGYASTFACVNRNKRSVAADLGTERGQEVLRALAERADVVVCSLRPSAARRLQADHAALAGLNPRLVYCSITGFGEQGPNADRPGYDTVGQALGGLLSLLVDLDAPELPGISLADHVTGLFACHGILAALLARERTGSGQKVETSLLQATASFVQEGAARYFATGASPRRATRVASAQVFAFLAGDGLPFVVHLSSPPKFWDGLTRALGRKELRDDPRFVDRAARIERYHELRALLAEAFGSDSRGAWLARLEAEGVPCAPIRTLDEVFADPGVQTVELEHPTAGRVRLAGSAVGFAATPVSFRRAPPLLGEHTNEVLAELGHEVV